MQHELDKKAIALAVFSIGLVAGFIPYFLKQRRSSSCLARGVSFAGGVLLGAGLIHLLPDAELVALSVHSLLAGYALGEQTSLATTAALLIAVLAHKGMATFTLGVSLYRMRFNPSRAAKSLLFFACTTPLGIVLGSATISVLSDSSLWVGISDALAVGTFLYIAPSTSWPRSSHIPKLRGHNGRIWF